MVSCIGGCWQFVLVEYESRLRTVRSYHAIFFVGRYLIGDCSLLSWLPSYHFRVLIFSLWVGFVFKLKRRIMIILESHNDAPIFCRRKLQTQPIDSRSKLVSDWRFEQCRVGSCHRCAREIIVVEKNWQILSIKQRSLSHRHLSIWSQPARLCAVTSRSPLRTATTRKPGLSQEK